MIAGMASKLVAAATTRTSAASLSKARIRHPACHAVAASPLFVVTVKNFSTASAVSRARPASIAMSTLLRQPAGRVARCFPSGRTTALLSEHYGFTPSHHLGAVTHFSSFFGRGGNRPPSGNRVAQAAGLLGGGAYLFGKTKYLLAAMKFTKLSTLGSMIFTIGTYSMFFGWPYAVGVVGLIAIHEAGHAIILHQKGIPFSPAVFVPFMGAVIVTKELPRDAWDDAVIAYGGPALGSLGAAGVAVGAHLTDSQLLYALADFGFMVNLFNLMPLGSMDGGRIAGCISPYAGIVGVGMGGALAYTGAVANPILYLVLMGGTYETFMRFYDPANYRPPGYYQVPFEKRAAMTAGYFGLIAALLAAMDANKQRRKPPEVLMREREQELSFDMR